MKLVPKDKRVVWHDRAMATADDADLPSLIELLLETKEFDRLADRLRRAGNRQLEAMSHYVTEPAAKKLRRKYPEIAARLWSAQAMRILNARKSRYYEAALSNFREAKLCYAKARLTAQWEKTVSRVRVLHYRKGGFMSSFEKLVAGSGSLTPRPSFLEQDKARWGMRKNNKG